VREISLFDASTFPVRIAAEVKGFSFGNIVADQRIERLLDRGAQFGVAAAHMAMADAGLRRGEIEPARLGVCLAAGPGRLTVPEIAEAREKRADGSPAECCRLSPMRLIQLGYLAPPSVVARLFDAAGPNLSVHMASASSAHCIGIAQRAIRDGDATVMIAGGFDSAITPGDVVGLARGGLLSTRNDEPERASRPFDRDRDGFVLGEGGVVIILEELTHAKIRGARIYGELAGYGATLSAYRIADAPPDGHAYARAMAEAIRDAGLVPEDVDYIHAYANSTKDVDRREVVAIKDLFGKRAYDVPVSSTKSMTGHLTLASGAAGLAFAALALRDSVMPPTINYENPDPNCDLDCVPNRARWSDLRVVLCNAFGLGGTNASLVVRKVED